MRAPISLPVLAVLALASPAAAQTADAQQIARDAFPGANVVADAVDFDLDGETEILVRFPFECDDAGCRWSILEHQDGSWIEAAGGRGTDTELLDVGGAYFVVSSGVTWAWNGTELAPTQDLLEGQLGPATEAQLALAYEALGLTAGLAGDPVGYAAELDLNADGHLETVVSITDPFWLLEGAYAPFVLLSEDGEKLVSGYSMDAPRLFAIEGGTAVQVVGVVPGGVSGQRWPQ